MIKSSTALLIVVLCLSSRAADKNGEASLLGAVPSEVQAPTVQVVKELLNAICQGQVALPRPGCIDWDRTPESGGMVRLHSIMGILSGHFLTADSDDILVSAERGEGHVDRYGGTMLLTKRSGVWVPLWYHSSTITCCCMKIGTPSGRDIPICESAYIMGGHQTHDLYALRVLPTEPFEQLLLSTDTFAMPNRAQKETLDSVRWLGRGRPVLKAQVHYFRSGNAAGLDLDEVLKKTGEVHTIDFFLKDSSFVVAPSSASFLKSF